MLWTLLMLMTFTCCIAGSEAAATSGAFSHLAAGMIGVVVGLASAWAANSFGGHIGDRLLKAKARERSFALLYAFAFLWIIVSGLMGSWLTSHVLRMNS